MILNDLKRYQSINITDMPNYQNGKVYKLVSSDTDEEYVGSTTVPLFKRFYQHKNKSRVRHSRLYLKIREIGINKWRIVLLENYPCNLKEELTSREEYWRKVLNAKLNMNKCCTPNKGEIAATKAKHYKENKGKIAATKAKYQEKNKDKISARKAKLITCECGREISKGFKYRHMKSKIHQSLMDEKNKDEESYPLAEINFIDE